MSSVRTGISVLTLVILGIIIYAARQELFEAWQLLGSVNIAILLLIIPAQIISYYAAAEMGFSYLRAKDAIGHLRASTLVRLALEMNFVNHVLPSAGVSGVSYMSWRLSGYGVRPGRATMSQIVRFAMGFVAFAVLLVLSVILITIDGTINRWIILGSATFLTVMIGATIGAIFVLSSPTRMHRFARWFSKKVNNAVRKLTAGRKKSVVREATLIRFFTELHDDYLELNRDKRVLKKPFWWGIVFTIADVAMFWVTFLALGAFVNPAALLIAYGLALMVASIAFTPGGAGFFETVMVAVLVAAGTQSGLAIAGILLTRVLILLGTILFGYVFYQHAVLKYGKSPIKR